MKRNSTRLQSNLTIKGLKKKSMMFDESNPSDFAIQQILNFSKAYMAFPLQIQFKFGVFLN